MNGEEQKQKIENIAKKKLIAAHYIKSIFFSVLAIALVLGNFFYESTSADADVSLVNSVPEMDYAGETIIPHFGVLRFPEPKIHNIDNSVDLSGSSDNGYLFEVNHGHFWANFSVSSAKTNILIDDMVLIPNRAAFELFFDGSKFELEVYEGDVYMGLLPDGVKVTELQDEYSELFMNYLLVPRGSQVAFSVSKIDEDLSTLLYSKLVKELKLSGIPSAEKTEAFIVDNLADDEAYFLAQKQEVESRVLKEGLFIKEGLMSDFLFWAEGNLTFVPERKSQQKLEHAFINLDNALYYYSTGDDVEGYIAFNSFLQEISALPKSFRDSSPFVNRFNSYLNDLRLFTPDDPEYELFDALLANQFEEGGDSFAIVSSYWRDVYRAMNESKSVAETALDRYYSYFDQTLGGIDDKEAYKRYLAYNNQLFDNLFLRDSVFYSHGYFVIKGVIEKNLVEQFDDPEDVREIEQSYIDRKIDFLKRLRKHFFAEEISVEEAEDILELLLNEIDDLMPSDTSSVAILEIFKTELEDYEDFYGYLNSPEYHSSIYGGTHEKRYDSYLDEREKIWSFVDIQEDVLGEVATDKKDAVEIAKDIESALKTVAEVTEITVGQIDSIDQRYVQVNGVIAGYPFEALYDRDQDSLSEVYALGRDVVERPVKISNLLTILLESSNESGEVVPEDELGIETYAERALRIYIKEILEEAGFELNLEQVSQVNSKNAVYNVENVSLKGFEDKVVSFDILMSNQELITNVLLTIDGNLTLLDGKFTIEEFAAMIEGDNLIEEVDLSEEDVLSTEDLELTDEE